MIKVGGVIVWRELVSPENRAFICSISIASGGLLAILAQFFPPTSTLQASFVLAGRRSSSRQTITPLTGLIHMFCDWSPGFAKICQIRWPTECTSWLGSASTCFPSIASGGLPPIVPPPRRISPTAEGFWFAYRVGVKLWSRVTKRGEVVEEGASVTIVGDGGSGSGSDGNCGSGSDRGSGGGGNSRSGKGSGSNDNSGSGSRSTNNGGSGSGFVGARTARTGEDQSTIYKLK